MCDPRRSVRTTVIPSVERSCDRPSVAFSPTATGDLRRAATSTLWRDVMTNVVAVLDIEATGRR